MQEIMPKYKPTCSNILGARVPDLQQQQQNYP